MIELFYSYNFDCLLEENLLNYYVNFRATIWNASAPLSHTAKQTLIKSIEQTEYGLFYIKILHFHLLCDAIKTKTVDVVVAHC